MSRLGALLAAAFPIIRAVSARTPHHHLKDLDGSLYMGRWRVIDEGTWAGRMLEKYTGYSSIRLHHINRADHDRDLHSHPFEYRSFILKGFYSERFQDGVEFTRKDASGFNVFPSREGEATMVPESRCRIKGYRTLFRGNTVTGGSDKFHRIMQVSEGGVWTLFCMTKNKGAWGFNVDGRLVDSTRYLLRKGYDRESVREAFKHDRKEN